MNFKFCKECKSGENPVLIIDCLEDKKVISLVDRYVSCDRGNCYYLGGIVFDASFLRFCSLRYTVCRGDCFVKQYSVNDGYEHLFLDGVEATEHCCYRFDHEVYDWNVKE